MNEYLYQEIAVGQEEGFSKEITVEMENLFRNMTDDRNPLHWDDAFAKDVGNFDSHVSFGMLSASMLSTLAGVYLPGKYSLIHSIDNISFRKPVFAGDLLYISGTVTDKQDGLNLILVKVKMTNQHNKTVLTADMKILVKK